MKRYYICVTPLALTVYTCSAMVLEIGFRFCVPCRWLLRLMTNRNIHDYIVGGDSSLGKVKGYLGARINSEEEQQDEPNWDVRHL